MPAQPHSADPSRWLPLPPQDLQLLLAVAGQPLHGYAMMKAVEQQSGGALRVELGSLYRMIQRLERDGLIGQAEMFDAGPAPGRDRRYYAITSLGRGVIAAELERLRRVLDVAAATPLRPGEA
jgi:DNA-binding PadR family transcriptional regulator